MMVHDVQSKWQNLHHRNNVRLPKRRERARRFFHESAKEMRNLKTYDLPSCGCKYALQWLKTKRIKFENLMKNIQITKTVLQHAIDGILTEGEKIGKRSKAKKLCASLMEHVNNKRTTALAIGETCANLYTRDDFLYKRANRTLRKEVFSNFNLAPYCALLSAYLQERCLNGDIYKNGKSSFILAAKKPLNLFRGTNLTADMIKQYEQNLGQRISWPAFSSTTRNKALAEVFGNTLFVIDATVLTAISTDYLADIQHVSNFEQEEEVLLAAGINLVIGDVTQRSSDGKYQIMLYVSKNYKIKGSKINSVPLKHSSTPVTTRRVASERTSAPKSVKTLLERHSGTQTFGKISRQFSPNGGTILSDITEDQPEAFAKTVLNIAYLVCNEILCLFT